MQMVEGDLQTNDNKGVCSQAIKGTVQRGNAGPGRAGQKQTNNNHTATQIKQMKITSETFAFKKK